jgi:hypothetical protein
VRRAFAAEGLPLTVDYRDRGTVFLSHSSFVMPVGDVNVSVGPPNEVRGAVYVVVMQGHRVVRARNVIVDFAPTRVMCTEGRRCTRSPSAAGADSPHALLRIWKRSSRFTFFVLAEQVVFCAVGAEKHSRGRLVELAADREVAEVPTSELGGIARQWTTALSTAETRHRVMDYLGSPHRTAVPPPLRRPRQVIRRGDK